MRDIGKAGEFFFGGWCASSGITANPSMSDAHGWDVLIEMNSGVNASDPLRVHEGMLESKVQIKSTDGGKTHVDVELSNLHKMATSSLPTFYVLIEFEKGTSPVRAYLKHIDHAFISQILKRVSDLTAKNSKVKLNEKTMRVKFSEEISPLVPEKMRELILKHVGVQSAYVESKLQHLRSAGYEEGAYKLQFTISNPKQLERLIDASLGKDVGVEVEGMQGSVVRFGLSNPIPELAASTAVLSMMQIVPDGQGSVSFRNRSTGVSYNFHSDIYRGVINSILPIDRRKIRIDAGFFEVTVQSKGNAGDPKVPLEVNMNLQLEKSIEVEDLLKIFNVFQMLRTPKGIEFGLDFFDAQSYLPLNTSESFEDCSQQISTLNIVVQLKRDFEWSQPLLLTFEEIMIRARKLERIYPVFFSKLEIATITFDSGNTPPVGLEADCLYAVGINLGPYLFVKIIVIRGTVEKLDDKKDKIDGQLRGSIFKAVFKETDDKFRIKSDIAYAISNYESEVEVVDFSPVFFKDALGMTEAEALNSEALESPIEGS